MVLSSCPLTTFSDAPLSQARPTSSGVFHTAEHYYGESPSMTEVDPRLPHTPPSTASHSNNAGHEPYRLKRLSDAVSTTAISSVGTGRPVPSKEVRVSLPSRKSSDGEPGPLPVMRDHRDSVVNAPTSAAGYAEWRFLQDTEKIVLNDVQAKAPPSIPENLDVMTSILDGDATSGEGSLM